MPQIVIGTAGHIDHGKTSLVKALTGFDTDQLIEEKRRGMTIDLGFAYLNDCLTIIDVPGHEKFIRNMTAGAAGIHFALIVVAADDGIMPQTKEHIEILSLLGINRGWVVITKVDLVKDLEWIDLIELDIREYLSKCGFHPFSFHRINNLTGEGINELNNNIQSDIVPIKLTGPKNYFRMHVDRFFNITGFGTVVTGTVIQGQITTGAQVEILPNSLVTKIRNIHSHGKKVNNISIGDRAAINLAHTKTNILNRGSVISTPKTIKMTKRIIAHVEMIKFTDWYLKNKQRVRIHFGTSQVLARVLIKSKKEFKKEDVGSVIFNLESEIPIVMDDLFVIRTYSPIETIAGGKVLDPYIMVHLDDVYNYIDHIPLDPKTRFLFLVNIIWDAPKTINEWEKIFLSYNDKIVQWCEELNIKISDKSFLFTYKSIKKGEISLTKFFKKFHRDNPFKRLIPFETLISFTKWENDFLYLVLLELIKKDIIKEKDGGYCLTELSFLSLSKSEVRDIQLIEDFVDSSGSVPILFSELLNLSKKNPNYLKGLINTLVYNDKVIKLGFDFYMHNKYLILILKDLKKYFSSSNELKIGDFKKLTGLTRKTAIPLLEYFDKKKYTIRKENFRIIGNDLSE